MTLTHSFEACRYHARFRVTARGAVSGLARPHVELLVEDTESGASFKLIRPELMPLLKAVKEAIKEVEDAATGLPTDPVERASMRIPHRGLATSMQRAHILNAYREEMEALRNRFVERFDKMTTRSVDAGSAGSGG